MQIYEAFPADCFGEPFLFCSLSCLRPASRPWMAAGTSTPSLTSSKSLFLLALCLSIFIDTFGCRSSANGTVKFRFSNNQWNHIPEQTDKCPSLLEGAKKLEQGVQLPLTHAYGSCSRLRPKNLSREELVGEILEGDRARMHFIRSGLFARSTASTEVPVKTGKVYGTGIYVATVGVGTPVKYFTMLVDTGSSLTWLQCEPCIECYTQAEPIFDPRRSTSYEAFGCESPECDQLGAMGFRLPCTEPHCAYGIFYRDESVSTGSFGRETLRLGSDSVENFKMGCGHRNTGRFRSAAGILALGQGAFSLPSQTAGRYREYFSYCLPGFVEGGSVGWLRLGPSAVASSSEAVYTSILPNPASGAMYFVGLQGISVGGERLDVPPGVFEEGGTVLDSGTACTGLVPAAYDALKAAFLEGTAHLPRAPAFGPLDTCYSVRGLGDFDIPTIELHFSDSATVELNGPGTLLFARRDGSKVCLAFQASSDRMNVIGSFQQQGFRVTYDLPNARIGFAPESCGPA